MRPQYFRCWTISNLTQLLHTNVLHQLSCKLAVQALPHSTVTAVLSPHVCMQFKADVLPWPRMSWRFPGWCMLGLPSMLGQRIVLQQIAWRRLRCSVAFTLVAMTIALSHAEVRSLSELHSP